MVSFTTAVSVGMSAGGAVLGKYLWNRPIYGLCSGVIHSVIAIGIEKLLGKTVSVLYVASVFIYSASLIGGKAQEIQNKTSSASPIKKGKLWTNTDRIKVAQETLQCIEKGYYTNSNGDEISLKSGKDLYNSSQSFVDLTKASIKKKYPKTDIIVVNQDCMEVAQEHAQQGYSVALLNFASSVEPGGGALDEDHGGTNGQEEQLCYSSELAGFMQEVLKQSSTTQGAKFFPLNNYQEVKFKNAINWIHHQLVYTPDVQFFRSNAANNYEFLDTPFKVGILSSAAPVEPTLTSLKDGSIDYKDKATKGYVKQAIALQLYAAHVKGHDTVILGAFGCGAFKNPPQAVAKIYKEVIDKQFQRAFKKIVFAILEDPSRGAHNPKGNLKSFQDCFASKLSKV